MPFLAIFVILVLMQPPLVWCAPEVFQSDDGIALDGYDVVAFFERKQAVKGHSPPVYKWKNAIWQFSSEENFKKFVAAPEQYAPQYGGYCAFAMSKGKYAPADPFAWTIKDGKLYLNFNKNVRTMWRADMRENITKADRHWKKLNPWEFADKE